MDTLTALLCERCLVAMARNQWDQAEEFAAGARAVLLRAEAEDPSPARWRPGWPSTGATFQPRGGNW